MKMMKGDLIEIRKEKSEGRNWNLKICRSVSDTWIIVNRLVGVRSESICLAERERESEGEEDGGDCAFSDRDFCIDAIASCSLSTFRHSPVSSHHFSLLFLIRPARTIRDTDTLYELPCSLTEIVSFQIKQTWVFHSSGFLWENGVKGLINIWPRPTAIAWKIIFCYGAFEAALQLLLPGKRVEGPVSPTGNRPVYKDNGMAAYFVTLATYLGLWWFGIFNPAIGHVAPSSSDSGSCGNTLLSTSTGSKVSGPGMELYPRIGKNFDIKVFTNCRFGMMSWAVLAVTYCIKQYEINGRVSDSMLVNTILMLVYVTKFFGWEAGYWNSMDIAHDRGMRLRASTFAGAV
ncbi:hypothetical protein F2Q69_00029729 [Brassica cretica]|uniref:7-dehydrocholesterol reductase n=1 Tax=Brassica cretica TaxID=69181 RepID=A0A8S9RZP1_BRACR|nr:hypothetical protein F2Q69_00029729 [Brassica cretica]